ncbi:putative solute-binding protein family 3/ domain of MltF [Helianthus annuus]|nr:putative solute-binding protein family 3/ domain of MltF [Helianthus annuus]
MAQKHSKIFLLLLLLCLLNLQVLCKTLKVGILTRKNFKYFIDADHDGQKNVTNATGFSLDVFRTCIHALPYEVPYKFIPFTSGGYDDLIKKVYDKEIDAIMGDSTILANRSQYVDFTATYTDMGIGTLAKQNNNDMWIFLKPLDETMVNLAGLTHWSRQEGLIPSSRRSLAGSPVDDLLHKETSRDS